MKLFLCLLLIIGWGSVSSLAAQELAVARKAVQLMGCGFELTVIADNDTNAWSALNKGIEEITRIEKLISSWDSASQTTQINQAAGKEAVVVDQELYDLIYRSKKVAQLTDGAFDISFASMDRIWKFNRQEQVLPAPQIVADARNKVNWQDIILNAADGSVGLKKEGMKIGFGAIGKGYAANRAKQLMAGMKGVVGGLVNASGDISAWGINPNGDHWKIQITDPKDQTKIIGWVSLKDMAIVTSGDYEKYFLSEGKRYAHIINPKTGYPTTGIKSVSVICPDAELGDALATSIFVLGAELGLELINQLHQIECLIVTDQNEMLTSKQLHLNKERNVKSKFIN